MFFRSPSPAPSAFCRDFIRVWAKRNERGVLMDETQEGYFSATVYADCAEGVFHSSLLKQLNL